MQINSVFIFENLEVYKRSLSLSIQAVKMASDFNFKYSRIRDQFIGAIISIPLNISEGNGRSGIKDKSNFYRIARGSAFECIPIISICFDVGIISENDKEYFRQELNEISMMLSGLIRYQKSKSDP